MAMKVPCSDGLRSVGPILRMRWRVDGWVTYARVWRACRNGAHRTQQVVTTTANFWWKLLGNIGPRYVFVEF